VLGPKPWSPQLFSRGCAPGFTVEYGKGTADITSLEVQALPAENQQRTAEKAASSTLETRAFDKLKATLSVLICAQCRM